MSRQEKVVDFEALLSLDDAAPVSSLTIGQFKELIFFKQRQEHLDALVKSQREEIAALKNIQENTQKLFTDNEKLSAVSTPFRLRSSEDVDRFVASCRAAIDGKQTVLIAMATEEM